MSEEDLNKKIELLEIEIKRLKHNVKVTQEALDKVNERLTTLLEVKANVK